MTVLQRVSAKEMEEQTGFRKALGYSFPKEDKILIRKDLPKKIEKKVIQHEEEHILKGEEGPGFFDFLGSIFAAKKQASSANKATAAQERAAQEQIAFAGQSRDLVRGDQAPYREAGYTALEALMSMTGLAAPNGGASQAPPNRGAGRRNVNAADYLSGLGGDTRRARGRNYGGALYGRNQGGALYNINELGPESVYENGSYTRSGMPMTVPPSNGYVAPNIQGRDVGGNLSQYRGVPPNHFNQPLKPPPGPDQRIAPGRTAWPSLNNSAAGVTAPSTIDNATGAPVETQAGAPQENPGGVEGGYNFMTDPGYNFRIGEGQRAIERGAAAAGGLLSGGYGRRLTRYAQDYASNEYTNVYNRISAIAGIGQTANQASGNAALLTGQQMGNAAGDAGYARASGYAAQGDIWGNALRSAGGYFDDLWGNRNSGGGGGGSNTTPPWLPQ